MKNNLIVLFAILAALPMAACELEVVADHTTGAFSLSGTVNVAAESDWDNLKIGFFPAFGETEGLEYETDTRVGGGSYAYLYYEDLEDLSTVQVTPAALADMTGSTGSSDTYSLELPSNPAVSEDDYHYYHLAVWYDQDNDNTLDLIDTDWFDIDSVADVGEYNVLTLKDFGGTNPAFVYDFFYGDNEYYTGYKYSAFDGGEDYYAEIQLGGSTGNSYGTDGFDFEVDI
jgi:hypothetical protein